MYYQYGQNRIFGAKFDPEIYKRGILFIGSPGMLTVIIVLALVQSFGLTLFGLITLGRHQ